MMGGAGGGSINMHVNVYGNVRPLERSIRRAAGAFQNVAGQSMRPLGQGLSAATVKASEFTKSIEASNARVLAFGASAGVIYGLVRAMRELVTATVEVEVAMREINVLVNETGPGLKRLQADLFNVARESGQAFAEVANAAKEFARQGLTAAETLTRVRDAMILTRLSGIDAREAVKTITAALNTFRQEALKSSEVINKMANVDAAFAVSMEDLAASISRAGAVAAGTGVQFDQLMGMVAAAQQITARGGKVIGNALKTIIIKMERPRMIDYMNKIGIETRATAGFIKEFSLEMKYAQGDLLDFQDRMTNLSRAYMHTKDSVVKLSHEQRSQIDLWAGGLYQVNILKALIMDYAEAQGIAAKATKISADSGQEAYERMYRLQVTLDHAVKGTKATLTELGRAIGELGIDQLMKDVLGGITKLSQWMSNLVGGSGRTAKAIQGIFKGIGEFLTGPGFAAAILIIGKFLGYFVKQGMLALASLAGITTQTQRRAVLEQQIATILSQEAGLVQRVAAGEMTRQQAAARVLATMQATTLQMQQQQSLLATTMGAAARGGAVMMPAAPRVGRFGMDTVPLQAGVPNFAMGARLEDVLTAARAEAAAGYTPMVGYHQAAGGVIVYGKEQGSAAKAVQQHVSAGQTIAQAKRASFASQRGTPVGKKKVPHFDLFGPMAMGMGALAMSSGFGGGGAFGDLEAALKSQLKEARDRSNLWEKEKTTRMKVIRLQQQSLGYYTGSYSIGAGAFTGGPAGAGGGMPQGQPGAGFGPSHTPGGLAKPEIRKIWEAQREAIRTSTQATSVIKAQLASFDTQVGTQQAKGMLRWLQQTGMLHGGPTGMSVQGKHTGGPGAWTYGGTQQVMGDDGKMVTKGAEPKFHAFSKIDMKVIEAGRVAGASAPQVQASNRMLAELHRQTMIAQNALLTQYGDSRLMSQFHGEEKAMATRLYNEQMKQNRMIYRPIDESTGKTGRITINPKIMSMMMSRMAGPMMIGGPVLGSVLGSAFDPSTRTGKARQEGFKGAGSTMGYAAMGYMMGGMMATGAGSGGPIGAGIGAAIGIMQMASNVFSALGDTTYGVATQIEQFRSQADALSSALTNAATAHSAYIRNLNQSGIKTQVLTRTREKFQEALAEAVGKISDPRQMQRLRSVAGDWESMRTVMGDIAEENKKGAVMKKTELDLLERSQESQGFRRGAESGVKWFATIIPRTFSDWEGTSPESMDKLYESFMHSESLYRGRKGAEQLTGDARKIFDSIGYFGQQGMRSRMAGGIEDTKLQGGDIEWGMDQAQGDPMYWMRQLRGNKDTSEQMKQFIDELSTEDIYAFNIAFENLIRNQEHGKKVADSYTHHIKLVTGAQREAKLVVMNLTKVIQDNLYTLLTLQKRLSNVFGGRQDILTGRASTNRQADLALMQKGQTLTHPFLMPEDRARADMSLQEAKSGADYTSGAEKLISEYAKNQVQALTKYGNKLGKDLEQFFSQRATGDVTASKKSMESFRAMGPTVTAMMALAGKLTEELEKGADPTKTSERVEKLIEGEFKVLEDYLPMIQDAIMQQTDKFGTGIIKLNDKMIVQQRLNEKNLEYQLQLIQIQKEIAMQGGVKSYMADVYGGSTMVAHLTDRAKNVGQDFTGWDAGMHKGKQMMKMMDMFKNYFGGPKGIPKKFLAEAMAGRAQQMAATVREFNQAAPEGMRLPANMETTVGMMQAAETEVLAALKEGVPAKLDAVKAEIVNLRTSLISEAASTQTKMQNAHESAIKNVLHNGGADIFSRIMQSIDKQRKAQYMIIKEEKDLKLETEKITKDTRLHEVGLQMNKHLDRMARGMGRTMMFGRKKEGWLQDDEKTEWIQSINAFSERRFGGRYLKDKDTGRWDKDMGAEDLLAKKRYGGKRDPVSGLVVNEGRTAKQAAETGEELRRIIFERLLARAMQGKADIHDPDTMIQDVEIPAGMFGNSGSPGWRNVAGPTKKSDWSGDRQRTRGLGSGKWDLKQRYTPQHRAAAMSEYARGGEAGADWVRKNLADSEFVEGGGARELPNWKEIREKVDWESMTVDMFDDAIKRMRRVVDQSKSTFITGGHSYAMGDQAAAEVKALEELKKAWLSSFDPTTGITGTMNQARTIETEYQKQIKILKNANKDIDTELGNLTAIIQARATDIEKGLPAGTTKAANEQAAKKKKFPGLKPVPQRRAPLPTGPTTIVPGPPVKPGGEPGGGPKSVPAKQKAAAEAAMQKKKDDEVLAAAMALARKRRGLTTEGGTSFAWRDFLEKGYEKGPTPGLSKDVVNQSGLMGLAPQAFATYKIMVDAGVDGKVVEAKMAAEIADSIERAAKAGHKIHEYFQDVKAALERVYKKEQFRTGKMSGGAYSSWTNQDMQGKVDRGTFDIGKDFGDLFTSQFARNYKDQLQEMKDLVVDLAATMKSSMKDAFKSWMSGAVSAKEALRDMVSGIFEKLLDRAIDTGINSLFAMTMGPSRAQGGIRVWGKGGHIPKYQQGGKVTGGNGVTDDVFAMMQGGEFVFKKAAAQRMGYDNLERMQMMAEGGQIQGFARGGMASFTGRHDVLFDDPKKPTEMKMVRDPMLSMQAMDPQSKNPQVKKFYEREAKWYDYQNYMHERAKAHGEAMKKFKRAQRNRLIGAAISAVLTIGGGMAAQSAQDAAKAAASQPLQGPLTASQSRALNGGRIGPMSMTEFSDPVFRSQFAASQGAAFPGAVGTGFGGGMDFSRIGQGAGQAAAGVTQGLGLGGGQMGQPTSLLGKMFGTTMGRTLTFGAAGVATGLLTGGEDKGRAAARMGTVGALSGFMSGMADITMPRRNRERMQRENAERLAGMRKGRGTLLAQQQQRPVVGGGAQRRFQGKGGRTGGPIFGKKGKKKKKLWWEDDLRMKHGGLVDPKERASLGDMRMRDLKGEMLGDIGGMQKGGSVDGMSADVYPAMLQGGEFVLNRNAVDNMRQQGQGVSYLNQLNQGGMSPAFAQIGGLVGEDLGKSSATTVTEVSDFEKLLRITEEVKKSIDHGNELQEKSPNETASKTAGSTTGGAGIVNNINISVNVAQDGKVDRSSSSTSNTNGGAEEEGGSSSMTRDESREFSMMIEGKVVEVINREQRPYGLLSKEKYQ